MVPLAEVDGLVEAAVARANRWATATADGGDAAERQGTERLAALVHDPAGVEFTMEFVDRVARPEDDRVAAAELVRLVRGPHLPAFLARTDRALMALGSVTAPLVPALVMPLARRRLRQLVGHLVRDAGSRPLRQALLAARAEGVRLNLNLLGEAVLGDAEAAQRLRRTVALLDGPDVDYVSVKVSAVAGQLDPVGPRRQPATGWSSGCCRCTGRRGPAPAGLRQPRHGGVPGPRT